MTGPALRLVLGIAAGDLPGLLKGLGARAGRATPVAQEWHDTAAGDLATAGLVLVSWRDGARAGWRVARLWPDGLAPWGSDGAVVAEARVREALGAVVPDETAMIARFTGRRRSARVGLCRLSLIDGVVAGAERRRVQVSRIVIEGPGLQDLALPGAWVLGENLAGTALRLAGRLPARTATVLPQLDATMTVSDALAVVLAHFGERLRHLAPRAAEGQGPEPVHQMRVTVRRARSALKLFGRAAAAPALVAFGAGLRELGHALGPARDWDVFLGGITKSVAAAAGQAASRRLAGAAGRRREEGYDALRCYLDGDGFRRLGLLLAVGALDRPWEREAPGAALAVPIMTFADAALQRQWKRLMAPGADLSDLPEPRLHEIRLEAKRMRYAAELFAGLHDRKRAGRFVAHLAELQERLGQLNDGAVAATLLEALGPAGRGFGGGVARGLVSARGEGLRAGIGKAWRRMRETKRFWH